jgi:PhnB protein
MNLNPYLMFPGNCREALEFYAKCLDGTIEAIQTVAESPLDWSAEHGDRIFNSVFAAGNVRFMASDSEPGKDLRPGENFALFVSFPDAARQQHVYSELSRGGKVLFPLQDGFGMVEDRYKVRWMLALER